MREEGKKVELIIGLKGRGVVFANVEKDFGGAKSLSDYFAQIEGVTIGEEELLPDRMIAVDCDNGAAVDRVKDAAPDSCYIEMSQSSKRIEVALFLRSPNFPPLRYVAVVLG